MRNLNTPLKRLGLVILIIGLMMFFYGWSQWFMHDSVDAWEAFTRSVGFDTYYWYWYNYPISIGFYVSVLGFLLSYFYEYGIGKIIQWIRHG